MRFLTSPGTVVSHAASVGRRNVNWLWSEFTSASDDAVCWRSAALMVMFNDSSVSINLSDSRGGDGPNPGLSGELAKGTAAGPVGDGAGAGCVITGGGAGHGAS